MATTPSQDDGWDGWRQIFAQTAQFIQDNRAVFQQAALTISQIKSYIETSAMTVSTIQQDMKPYLETRALAVNTIRTMQADISLSAILTRQRLAFTAMAPALPVPTPRELHEAEQRLTELVPETDEEMEQVAEQAAEIQADPEGRQLIAQITGWLNEGVARFGDMAVAHKTEAGLLLLACMVFLLPSAVYPAAGLYCAAVAGWVGSRALGGK